MGLTEMTQSYKRHDLSNKARALPEPHLPSHAGSQRGISLRIIGAFAAGVIKEFWNFYWCSSLKIRTIHDDTVWCPYPQAREGSKAPV